MNSDLDLERLLADAGLPTTDAAVAPSAKRFPDGGQFRVEIPSTEGPACLDAVLEECERLDVPVHRVSQGSGVFMLTDDELTEMGSAARARAVEVSLFARPGAGWGTSAATRAAGAFAAPAFGWSISSSGRGTHLHLQKVAIDMSREQVRRARLGLELLTRREPELKMSKIGAEDLTVPVPASAVKAAS